MRAQGLHNKVVASPVKANGRDANGADETHFGYLVAVFGHFCKRKFVRPGERAATGMSMYNDGHGAYAAFELYLDLHYILHGFVQSDYEATIIYACVAEATLRPRVVGGSARAPLPSAMGEMGNISRLLVADRTGLPRETVRRKISMMIDAGLLMRVARGSVSISLRPFSANAEDVMKAVKRYQSRVARAKIDSGDA